MKKATGKIVPILGMSLNDVDGLATEALIPITSMTVQKINRKGRPPDSIHRMNAGPVNGDSQRSYNNHQANAVSNSFADQGPLDHSIHMMDAKASKGESPVADQTHGVYAFPYPIISALWRQRYAWVKSRTAMTLSAQARCRAYANGDKGEASKIWKAYCRDQEIDALLAITLRPYQNAIAMFDTEIKPVEKQLTKLVKTLPCYDWMIAHKGIGALYIAGIYGECNGPITKSHSISALWKFFGLAVYEGKRQAFQSDAAENKKQSYSSRRRSLISQIETAFVMTSSPGWRELYEERKLYELAKGCQKGHAHNRAKRYIGKRFLRELYKYARTVEAGHGTNLNQDCNASLLSDLSNHIMDETQVCDVAQDKAVGNHYVESNHALDVPYRNILETA